MGLLECVPNLSEGRRPALVRRLVSAVEAAGVRVLDASSDLDHHRSVLTLAGEAENLHQGLLGLFEAALDTIDLRHHEGVHPRVGAVDVVPFVPLAGSTMEDAIHAARRLGEAVGERFQVPVFLYGEAHPEGRSLAAIRRGNLAGKGGLAERMATDPAWRPDFGPPRLHPTGGAVAIGARFFLIAFNVPLASDDIDAARTIARGVRASSGGLPAVKALGVPLPSQGRVQVSMNLVDYRQTSLQKALDAVRRQAHALGVKVAGTELIGLVPEAALEGYEGAEDLRERTIESRLAGASAPDSIEMDIE